MKPTKFAIAVVLPNPQNEKEVLAVLRPPTDESLPNVWGLPAVMVKEGEMPEDAVRRIGKEKLTTEIEPVARVGIKSHDRGEYELILMDVKAKLIGKAVSSKRTHDWHQICGAKMGDRLFDFCSWSPKRLRVRPNFP